MAKFFRSFFFFFKNKGLLVGIRLYTLTSYNTPAPAILTNQYQDVCVFVCFIEAS